MIWKSPARNAGRSVAAFVRRWTGGRGRITCMLASATVHGLLRDCVRIVTRLEKFAKFAWAKRILFRSRSIFMVLQREWKRITANVRESRPLDKFSHGLVRTWAIALGATNAAIPNQRISGTRSSIPKAKGELPGRWSANSPGPSKFIFQFY